MENKINIIGIGMDGMQTLTIEAIQAIEKADLLIGSKRMLTPFEHLKKRMICEYKSEKVVEHIRNNHTFNISVLMSGDCGFFSGANSLKSRLNKCDVNFISGISTPIYFCSKIQMNWNDLHFISLHGRNSNIVRNVAVHEKTFFLLGGDISASDICSKLCEYDLGNLKVFFGENLASVNERILTGVASDFINLQTDSLCALIVVNSNYENYTKIGISDEEFIRGSVPMTKSEIRSVLISKLKIKRDDNCWDIGCGTGSVSVEMAMQCSDGTVFSVDKNPEAIKLTDENRHKFCCDNIEIVNNDALNVINDLPAPDSLFVGGSGNHLEKIMTCAYTKNNTIKVVVTAVSLETLNSCITVFEKLGFESEITQIAVTRTKKIGNHTMLSSENPIFIIKRKSI